MDIFPFQPGTNDIDLRKYKPQILERSEGRTPTHAFIQTFPWISYRKAYCEPASLQMLMHHYGIKEDIGYFSFIMGYAYGSMPCLSAGTTLPFSDPESGLDFAVECMGLQRTYYVTDEAHALLDGIRNFLSGGSPVRILLNLTTLKQKTTGRFLPHTILLRGFHEGDFFYYESTMRNRYIEGSRGLAVTGAVLLSAIRDLSSTLSYPWTYAFSTFTNARDLNPQINRTWTRNGLLMLGSEPQVSRSETLAEQFSKEMMNYGPEHRKSLRWRLHFASYSRLDNAAFLSRRFGLSDAAQKAASLFEEIGKMYGVVCGMLPRQGYINGDAIGCLHSIAALEKKTGKLLKICACASEALLG